MKTSEKNLWKKVQTALSRGLSYKIDESEREAATNLVKDEKCFWSIDYDHIQAYNRDHSILTTGSD